MLLNSSKMSLMLCLENMLFSLNFASLSNTNFPRRLVLPLLICVDLLKTGLAHCPHLACV